MGVHGAEIVDQIQNYLSNERKRSPLPHILSELRTLASRLSNEEKSSDFHNLLRGFNRCWGDEFCPEEGLVAPLLNELFELHGYPDQRSRPK
jgi:hypothetical protein